MLHGENNPTLVRDTLFAIVMIILGGMIGGSLLLGGWRNMEQHYNLQSANAYLGVIIPLSVLTLTLPDFTTTTAGPTLSFAQQIFICVMSVGLYVAFLAIQTGRHRGYFISDGDDATQPPALPRAARSLRWHASLLLAYILPVVFLAEQLAHPIDYFIETLKAPAALGGIAIAMLVATPEAIGATRTAFSDRSIFLSDRFSPRSGLPCRPCWRSASSPDTRFTSAWTRRMTSCFCSRLSSASSPLPAAGPMFFRAPCTSCFSPHSSCWLSRGSARSAAWTRRVEAAKP
jgi:hypothetical protein